MKREVLVCATSGAVATSILGLLILVGSRNLSHFDAALAPYTVAILFATFGLAYRYRMWLERPPTRLYWRRGWQAFLRPGRLPGNIVAFVRRVFRDLLTHQFVFQRGAGRGIAHFLIMWGCLLAVAITFPLVFGWIYFRSAPGDLAIYEAVVFGFPGFRFAHQSTLGFLLFHGLVWSSFMVIAGVMLAMRRRMKENGAAALQRFGEDILPLVLLFAVSLSGLLLTASYTWMKGYGYDFLALFHAVTVIGTFLWLPFGKFFHIFQRPAQLGIAFYKDAAREGEAAHCRRCGHPFTSRRHVEDLIEVQRALGYRYEVADPEIEHYQWICPPCRRASLALAQTGCWSGERGGRTLPSAPGVRPRPMHANRGLGSGPLGSEDSEGFYP